MQAIVTRYHGPTNTRGSRYSASTESGHRISVSANYSLDAYENHERAAKALMAKLGWSGDIVGGGVKGGYVFVFCSKSHRDPGKRSLQSRKRATLARLHKKRASLQSRKRAALARTQRRAKSRR